MQMSRQLSSIFAAGLQRAVGFGHTICMVDTPIRKRRWLQYRLRTLLIAVLLLALPLSWIAMRMEKARRQREAVETIAELHGMVWYDYHEILGDFAEHPPIPSLLLKLLGDDFFSDVVGVAFFGDSLGDDDLKVLGTLPHIDFVILAGIPITDNGLRHLDGLPNLRCLVLEGSTISDAGLSQLEKLTTLTSLDLTGTKISDEGVRKLVDALPDCEVVSDYGPQRR